MSIAITVQFPLLLSVRSKSGDVTEAEGRLLGFDVIEKDQRPFPLTLSVKCGLIQFK